VLLSEDCLIFGVLRQRLLLIFFGSADLVLFFCLMLLRLLADFVGRTDFRLFERSAFLIDLFLLLYCLQRKVAGLFPVEIRNKYSDIGVQILRW
jgi:hypothetical protein